MQGVQMIQSIRKSLRSQLGQGMTEYIIIVALIAIAAIGVYSFFGETVRHQTAGMAKELSGQGASSEQSAAKTSADTAATKAGTKANLGNYGNQQ
jgi:Flp pilus assembly pilin Flp